MNYTVDRTKTGNNRKGNKLNKTPTDDTDTHR